MYAVTDRGVLKHVETWQVIVPLHDNDGRPFEKSTVDSILSDISLNYPGLTVVNCTGYWRAEGRLHIDDNLQLLIDAVPSSAEESARFFAQLKERLQTRLRQEKIYITKQSSKQELLSFDEFLRDVGIEPAIHGDASAKRRLTEQLVARADFVLQRLGYQTITLRRDHTTKTILWERRICGLTLESVFNDPYPADISLVAADQIERLATLLDSDAFAIIGHYEYQFYALEQRAFRPLARSQLEPRADFQVISYVSPGGEPLTVAQFVEHFTMSIAANLFALRDHGYLSREITINVGSDGSMQVGEGYLGTQLFMSPASIPDKPVQEEILRCVAEVCEKLDDGALDPISVQQAKALNAYILKRAFMKRYLPQRNP